MTNLSPLLALPIDVQQSICQHLFVAGDLRSLESCSRACRQIVNRSALWHGLLIKRFGQDLADQLSCTSSSVSVQDMKRKYIQLSRQCVPGSEFQVLHKSFCNSGLNVSHTAQEFQPAHGIQAVHLGSAFLVHQTMADSTFGNVLRLRNVCWLDLSASFQGVLPGQYQVLWRTRNDARRPVGMPHSEVHMAISSRRVQTSETGSFDEDVEATYPMSQFNGLPTGQWVDVSGGTIHIADFANITVRLWCHTGEWKSGLAWDYVKIVDVNQPMSVQPNVENATQPASSGLADFVGDMRNALQAAVAACRQSLSEAL